MMQRPENTPGGVTARWTDEKRSLLYLVDPPASRVRDSRCLDARQPDESFHYLSRPAVRSQLQRLCFQSVRHCHKAQPATKNHPLVVGFKSQLEARSTADSTSAPAQLVTNSLLGILPVSRMGAGVSCPLTGIQTDSETNKVDIERVATNCIGLR